MSVYNCFYNNSTCSPVQSAFPGNLSRCSGAILPHSLRSSGPPGVLLYTSQYSLSTTWGSFIPLVHELGST